MDHVLLVMAVLVIVALIFDFMNGFHDAANSIALMVSTRLLTPQAAVIWAAFFNFVAFLFFGLHVADTVGKGIIDPNIVNNTVVFGALFGAIAWNVITWWFGIPSSSSHALIGGLIGAGMAHSGTKGVILGSKLISTGIAIILSPLFGMLLAMMLSIGILWVFQKSSPYKIESRFNKMQFISSSLFSLGHGANDAQKTMGIITVLLFANGYLQGDFHVPFWVVIACQLAMGLGTLFGGWRIVRTMGMGITRIRPTGGFSAQTSGSIALFLATSLGIPVSTTHTITGAIVGVGLSRRATAVRWGLASRIVWAWVLTIPCAAIMAAFAYHIGKGFL
ncbi:inorganic phosphate transporter [Methylophilus aquaticus]|uniref:Inorganic phosphate transporter n=1 Tax=Methylophilus aquaticus TaxID=1971610 RepID=A0ABT9JSZ4_9PROT|nr:inorganic phosphate transporter [Methylophilus aquaticus]MDP8567665.1 inorganic phosphate transporter [Methylophilus aquaticus]